MTDAASNQRQPQTNLGDEIALLAAQIDAATHRLLCLIREFDRQQKWAELDCLSCAHWLSWRLGWTPATARDRLRVAHALAELPAISAAVETGEITYSKARAVTRVATPDSDAQWADIALEATAAQLERIVRRHRRAERSDEITRTQNHNDHRALHAFYDDDGMLVLQGRLAPEAGAVVLKALKAAAAQHTAADDESTFAQRQADALVELAEAALVSGSGDGGARAESCLVVHVDQEVLADPSAPGRCALQEGPAVSAETSRRLACDAHVVEMTHAAGGEVLSVGRKTRVVSTPLRRALRERDETCRFPSCTHRIVDAHHIEHWADGGETELDNLLQLCRRHHVIVHEGGYRIERDAGGVVTFWRPSGVRIPNVICSPRVACGVEAGAELADRNTRAGIHVDAMTAYPRWDGDRVDYDHIAMVMQHANGA